MKVPDFTNLSEVTRYLVDLAKDRDNSVKDSLDRNSANHSVLLASPSLKTYEITIGDTGLITVTLANDTATIPQTPFTEAPIDGSVYGRKNGAWSVVPVAEAPSDGSIYGRKNGAWSVIPTATKNYVLNGAMQVSQENGATAGTASAYYPVDLFYQIFTNTGTQTAQQVASATPAGSPNRLRVTCTAADAAVAAGDFLLLRHSIEGFRVADLRSGSAVAKTITISFGCKGPAGTYGVSLRNAAFNRLYAASYTISAGEANTDVVKTVTIALDQTGTWAIDNSIGLEVSWWLMAGSSFTGTPGVWGSTVFAPTGQFNFMGTNGNVFELFDVGLYQGSVAPTFIMPDFVTELASCKRYWWKHGGTVTNDALLGTNTPVAGAVVIGSWPYPVEMRATPVIGFVGSWGYGNAGSIASSPGVRSVYWSIVASGAGGAYYQNTTVGSYISFNARL